ncbi:MAG: hypothetical protein CMO47_09440 [Verrucomicrobiales bacterium]|nr:hypothetical protein [Verrucomicrobiales bacterium]
MRTVYLASSRAVGSGNLGAAFLQLVTIWGMIWRPLKAKSGLQLATSEVVLDSSGKSRSR